MHPRRRHAAALCALGIALCAAGCGTTATPALRSHARQLEQGHAAVQEALSALDRDLGAVQQRITAPNLLGGPFARETLEALRAERPWLALCATTDLEEHVAEAAPASKRYARGASILSPGHFNLRSDGAPVMGPAFANPDLPGRFACDVVYPLGDASGTMIGSLRARIDVTLLLGSLLGPVVEATPENTFWVIESDGVTLYDPDGVEIGKNVFTDMLYAPFDEMRETARRIVNSESGYGTFEFLGTGMDTARRKHCNWRTAARFGARWSVVLVREDR